MRLQIVNSKNATSLYVIKSLRVNGKNTSKVVEKLGTIAELSKTHDDPIAWANSYISELNRKEKEEQREVIVKYNQSKRLAPNEQTFFNGGYLFLQQIYHQLKIHRICKDISSRYRFDFNLDAVLSRLIYGRILFPTSKLGTLKLSDRLLEQPAFELQHIYRALEVIAKESDFIQAQLYKNTLALSKRNDRILFYDCTNFFFEMEQADGLKQYGPSKEHRPNPIVEMGLFMDGDGIPLAFCIHSGNTNEQQTIRPLEQQILKDFSLSRFVVCTDAGLSSHDNRKFNDEHGRAFITTQSIKKLKGFLKEWALDPEGWTLAGEQPKRTGSPSQKPLLFHIGNLENTPEGEDFYKDRTFYKERWVKEKGLEQRLIVTFSIKHRNYQQKIRSAQIARAIKLIETRPDSVKKHNQNDYKRLIKQEQVTPDGETADKWIYSIDLDVIEEETRYDGFYAVCTNLEDCVAEIVRINHRRWEIEESFRIMKTDFKARPVYLSRDDRIKAHFTTCFLALTLFRYLEKKLGGAFTSTEIIHGLQAMNFHSLHGDGYVPVYTRNDFTDTLHEAFDFQTDYQVVSTKRMKKIFKETKK